MQSIKNPPQKMTQRFCLRWNNHQSNLLSVFDQLLHAETFTDVTLAVEGQYLKAHKMVLSACSPYFNALFVNHPEKHPIVILKDVPYADMKSLLDFMYRGEVSVDQERLTAFLRVAETLRIKGLTEVNDDKPVGPSSPPPPPQLHRIQPYLAQQRKNQQAMMNSPLLGSALSMPKRKRGRPRKLSGSSNGTGNDFDDYDRENLIQGSPEMLEVKMGTEGYSGNEGSDDNQRESGDNDNEHDSNQERMDTSDTVNKSQTKDNRKDDNSTSDIVNNSPELTQRLLGISIKPDLETKKLMINSLATNSANTSSNYSNSLLQQQLRNDSLNNNNNTNEVSISTANNLRQQYFIQMTNAGSSAMNSSSSPDFYKANSKLNLKTESIEITPSDPTSPTSSNFTRQPQRRRVRRKATSSLDDQAEHLTEMSVRGLDLFRYASITEGIYQCTECAKENVQKTFKNKYSFQRHAFLYHEGKHRKVFPCPVCGKEFSRPDKMKNHMKTTHECFIPKEINYHHPLNYLITAAAAGDIPQLFSQMENSSPNARENHGTGYDSSAMSPSRTNTMEPGVLNSNECDKGDENAESNESEENITIVKNEILEQSPLPISIAEPSISIMEAEEVK